LDVSSIDSLVFLSCTSNQLTTLDVTNNPTITSLNCNINQLTTLDLTSNSALQLLLCAGNQITSLNVSNSPSLIYILCASNALTYLNVANGNNTNFNGMISAFNPTLSCIQVDDVNYATMNWTPFIDPASSFNTFCTPVSINKLEGETLKNVQVYPNPTSKNVSIDLNKSYKEITVLVSNTIGQVVLSKQYTAQQFINLDLEGNGGVYFVTIFT
jgi:hypothetical protein